MKILALEIRKFRGIERLRVSLGEHSVLLGPNGVGKSTIIDALSLVLGRHRLVRPLTEHDFIGSSPSESSRVLLVATIGGFNSDDPGRHADWFRDLRGVPKWMTPDGSLHPVQPSDAEAQLCVQIAFAARFDLDDLEVEQRRFFYDSDDIEDPFLEEARVEVPRTLLSQVGYYVLPSRRTWEAIASFGSDLFRDAVRTTGAIPASSILAERDRLREPGVPLEQHGGMNPLVRRINRQLAELLPGAPTFRLRVTSTDSESVLRGLVPHYLSESGVSLPASRHGTGLLALQTLLLLLEIGSARRDRGESFVLALEEPELHVDPSVQRRVMRRAMEVASQTLCVTHSPKLASLTTPEQVVVLRRSKSEVRGTCLLDVSRKKLPNGVRRLFEDQQTRLVEALMARELLIPEGRIDYELLTLLAGSMEGVDLEIDVHRPFDALVGVVPTCSQLVETYRSLARIQPRAAVLVDGDSAGSEYLDALVRSDSPPRAVLRWKDGWTIEDAVGWILSANEPLGVSRLNERLGSGYERLSDFVADLASKQRPSGLKQNYWAYEEVVAAISEVPEARERAARVLWALTACLVGEPLASELVREEHSQFPTNIYRISP